MKRESTPTETKLKGRAELLKSTAFPIADPFLNGVSELLTRITNEETSIEVARWYAGDALTLLRNYVTSKPQ